jgi:hypothetical protein
LSTDAFTTAQAAAGRRPYQPDNPSEGDGQYKENTLLVQERDGVTTVMPWKPDWLRRGAARLAGVFLDAFKAQRNISELLLHALALGQQLQQGTAPSWRERMHADRSLGYHVLVYHPGPVGTVTTVSHTDATWITLLIQDSTGGLEVRRNDDHAQWIPVPPSGCRVLVNTGNLLADATYLPLTALPSRAEIALQSCDELAGKRPYLFLDNLDASPGGTGTAAITRVKRGSWEYFALTRLDDGFFALQNARGAFLCPDDPGNLFWTFRAKAERWERLEFCAGPSQSGQTVTIRLVDEKFQHGGRYLAPGTELDSRCVRKTTPHLWYVQGPSFFPSVCHRVLRVNEAAASATRVSMPFFFGSKHGRTGGCS